VSGRADMSDLELCRWAVGDVPLGTATDMIGLFEQPAVIERLEQVLEPDAPIEFETPDGGFMGAMGGPFRGLGGLQAAWAEWTDPWEAWSFRGTDWIDAGPGQVLFLGDSLGRLAGSGLEVEVHAGALYTVESGRIVRIQHFLDQDQARRAAGLA